jgi:spermidine/putrescine-binding protein
MRKSNLGKYGLGLELDVNRREFLTLSGAAAGTLAMSGALWPAPAWAQQKVITGVMSGVVIPDGARAIEEKLSGVKVDNVPYVSPTDTIAKLLAPGGTSRYDLMISVTDFVKGPVLGAHAGDEKVRPFDLSKVPNAANLQDLFAKQVQVRGGKTLMIPIFWGYDSPLYNKAHIPEADPSTQTWNLLFDDKYAGKTAMRDDPYGGIAVAALSLGIKEPSAMSDSDLANVKKFLISKKKNFRTMWSKFAEAVNLMSSGEVWAMYGWLPMRTALQKQGLPVTNAWPKEGILIWNQSAFIPKESSNAALSEAVVNAMLSPEYGVALAKESSYGPVTKGALSSFTPEEQKQMGFDAVTGDVKRSPYSWPNNMNAWIQAWGEFKAA